ncbi:hypothetical protein DFH06DRAFT_1369766 [Mycena polygramma]|nr:hypothetical protein DFH06DRAFT_1369766 [Mycena polygramma]
MTTAAPDPSGLDADPSAYLALPRFNHSLDFEFALPGAASPTPATVTYALTAAPPDASWPLIVFFNGLGGHRLIAALLEGIARAHHVQILTLDRPGCGGSRSYSSSNSNSNGGPIPVPLASRTRWTHAAHLAVLAHLHTTRFAVISHSNGLFYALHTLLHLPPALSVSSWTLSGPFIPPQISGSTILRLASALPAALPNALGSLLQIAPPIARAVSWSGGLLSVSAGLLGAAGSHDDDEQRELRKSAHQRTYLHRSVTPATQKAMMARGIKEARAAMGQEALICLHGADTVSLSPSASASSTSSSVSTHDGEERDSVWALGAAPSAAEVLQNAFARIAHLYPPNSPNSRNSLDIHVVYGAKDILVPVQMSILACHPSHFSVDS